MTIFAAFDAIVAHDPDATALLGTSVPKTYAALKKDVMDLAACLDAEGVGAGDFVGLFASRSMDAITGMLACLHRGAVYVPLDPSFAPEQLNFIATDVPFKLVLATQSHMQAARTLFDAQDTPVWDIAACDAATVHPKPAEFSAEAAACILYTSGTTGRPKGVIVPHRAITAMSRRQPEMTIFPDDVVLSTTTIACDGALAEVFRPLLNGAAIALVETPTPDINDIADTMIRHSVTAAFWYAGMHHLVIAHRIDAFATLRFCQQGGDVMSVPMAKKLLSAWPDLHLFNGFGPTETCFNSIMHQVRLADLDADAVPIGTAMTGEEVIILDDDLRPVAPGTVGQIAIGGHGVALGYHNRPDATEAAFVPDPREGCDGTVYLTGDLGLQDSDGLFHFRGRMDRQIKMAGRRVEIDGIEHILRELDGVSEAVVELVTDGNRDPRLIAFVTTHLPVEDEPVFVAKMRAATEQTLARDVFPRKFVFTDSLPLTKAGKVDRKALRASQSIADAVVAKRNTKDTLGIIAAIWQDILGGDFPAPTDTFFDLGGSSLQLIDAHAKIEAALGVRFAIAEIFSRPRLGDLAAHFTARETPRASAGDMRTKQTDDHAVAIVGMAARLPGGTPLSGFWDVIREGRSLIERFDPSEAEDSFDAATRNSDAYVPARSLLRDVDQFDPQFFDMRPREAALMDPQGRVFLEICQEALDDAGIDPARTKGAIGVYAGAPLSTYMLDNLLGDRAATRNFTSGFQIDYAISAGNVSFDIATRVAYKLGLTGQAIAVSTACSTSLVAIAQACKALRAGDVDAVLAGGVSITFPQKRGYLYMESGMASSDGQCRPFDAESSGTVFGHGAGVVVLKRLSDAVADGDHIHAVIRGVGLNNDGAEKMSYTAPTVTGQAEAIRIAHRDAGVSPQDIGFIECHGTGTPLGDPIEIAGLAQAFGTGEGRCALGSVKGNLGHADAAAGVLGVIKAATVLRHKTIPPVAHFKKLNDRISLKDTPFWVPDRAAPWDSDTSRFAGVSSFGVGGTNAHIVMEQAPDAVIPQGDAHGLHYLPLSAKSADALPQMAAELAKALEAQSDLSMADVAYTLQEGRRVFDYRAAIVAPDRQAAIAELTTLAAPQVATKAGAPDVVFLFPGQGAQYPGMGADLYATEPAYARWIDAGNDLLAPIIGQQIRPLILGENLAADEAAAALRETRLTQPALFLTEFALGAMWRARGVTPAAVIGHSVGEFAAAALAGVMSFADALTLIATRGQLMQDQPGGSMLSVRASLDDLQPFMDETVDLAARNAPKLQVVAGPDAAIDALEVRLTAAGLACQHLHTSHAFHSKMMDPVTEALAHAARKITFQAPAYPIYSAVTGSELSTAQACDPAYWAAQARASVNFEAAVTAVADAFDPVFVEVGPGRALSTCAAQTLKRGQYRAAIQTLPDHTRPVKDDLAMAQAAAALWSAGVALNWSDLGPRGSRKVPLPSYAFQRQRCWVDPPEAGTAAVPSIVTPIPVTQEFAPMSVTAPTPVDRLPRLQSEICAILSDMSGDDIGAAEMGVSFIELGFDSLFLGQVSQAIAKNFDVQIGFRKLLGDVSTVTALAQHLDAQMPADLVAAPQPVAAPPAPQPVMPQVSAPATVGGPVAGVEGLLQAQLQTMQAVFAQQLQAMGQSPAAAPMTVAPVAAAAASAVAQSTPTTDTSLEAPVTFKLGRGASVTGGTLTDAQIAFAKELAETYSKKHAKSKAYTAAHRAVLADPRTAAGFRAEWKELTFPIVAERSKGAFIHDVDGNTFIDLVNGFGQTAFGHSPDFVRDAVTAQMEKGFPIGPQADLAGPVAHKFAKVVGHERVTFCNTGSEAVMAAMRLARTVTGRDLIVVFDRDYHGQFDEVLIKGKSSGTSADALPIAPGIPRSGLVNMKVLKYGAPESLNWIRDNIKDIAGVVVEPVQSRHPKLRPEDFVRELRGVTRDNGVALVIDEVVTGFRTDERGMQGLWGIQGDMATYGKVVGGGMPIGVLAGDAKFMDALDGGTWSFGDDSRPEAMPTFFAGTFVRHPLVLAAVDATLDHMAAEGDALWKDAAARTADVAAQLSKILTDRGLPDMIETYSSWFVMNVTEADPRATLLFPLMRMEGVHVMDGFCAFLTTEHGADECAKIVAAFEKAVDTLLSQGILGDLKGETGSASANTFPTNGVPIPLTESQREIWMSHQFGGMAAAAFNECGTLDLNGPLNVSALNLAWSDLVQRHDALRLRFARDGASFTVIDGEMPMPELLDFSTQSDPKAALKALVAEEGETPFDITAEPPVRATLVKLAEALHVFVITAHHIVADGWSFGVMLSDLAALYSAATKKTAVDLPAAPSFARLAVQEAAAGRNSETTAFWTKMHTPLPALPDLPSDRPRPEQRSYAGDSVFHEIDGDLIKAARKAGAKSGCTLFATTFAAMQILVHRISGADDFALGVPTAAQQNMDDPYLVGHCVNFLPIRIPIAQGVAIKDHLAVVRDQLNSALDHQDTTFGAIVQTLSVPRTLNRLPLAEIEFNLEQDKAMDRMAGLDATFRASAKRAVNFDLFFNVVETATGLRIEAHFNTDLFNKARVKGWAQAYEAILSAVAADTSQPVSTVSLVNLDAQQALLLSNTNVQGFDRKATLPDLIARAVAEQGDAPAITDINGTISYADLAAQSDALAALIQARVPGQGARIALCLRRDSGMVAGLLGILKAGHTYVPLDPNQPAARLRQIVETAEVHSILTTSADLAGFAEGCGIDLILTSEAKASAKPAPVTVSPEDPAYVIFTSGSTGLPKGVAVPHRALVNFLTSMASKPGFTPADKILAVTTVMFDIAALELLLPLTVGGQVEIAPTQMVVDGFRLAERLQSGDITMMQATPTLWDMALSAGFAARRGFTMLCGGEGLPQDLAERLLARGGTLWNMYGPTETTIWSAIKQVEAGDTVTIGGPIANTGLHILDAAGQIVPDGVVGELNISGEGLALGYFGQPDLTAKAFRNVKPGESTVRLYATGDLAQRTETGEIAVLGRIDTQVKLRGFRIELGEIETRLRAIEGIAKAAVDLRQRKNGDGQLVAYLVAEKDVDVSWDAVAAELAKDLPDYMVPRAFVMLSALPQTGNGKLDRKALPDPQETASVTPIHQVVAAETETEKRIAAIWQKVLERDQISVTETLHALGVDSLAMFRIAAHMLNDGLNLEARHMFAHPSIRALAGFHDGRNEDGTAVQRPSLKAYRDGAQRGRGKGAGK